VSGATPGAGPAPRAPECPICGKPVPPDEPARPFCCRRCKMVDLGRWFSEAYRVPGEDAVSFDDVAPTPPDAETPPPRP
jgi:endogenous inhibitor of DNA gyrase (YacG/DUF329 family)